MKLKSISKRGRFDSEDFNTYICLTDNQGENDILNGIYDVCGDIEESFSEKEDRNEFISYIMVVAYINEIEKYMINSGCNDFISLGHLKECILKTKKMKPPQNYRLSPFSKKHLISNF
ncbi:hypothetical protein DMUE_0534 [Dictyocoela muelleri]|nr:hypothetical protein DMUE_0534 [Dictyocoela muelleri]